MYQPPNFREDRLEVQHRLIQSHPLGLLVTAGAGGLMANPIPFFLAPSVSPQGTLQAHLARANPQLQELAAASECLIVFQGPQGYVTPSWYETKQQTGKVVPTWNYATVHAWGRPRWIEDPVWLAHHLNRLTRHQEQGRPVPWEVSDAPAPFIASQTKGIVGIELEISRIEGKWKVSQNRPEPDRRGVVAGFRQQGEAAHPMAALVAEYGAIQEE
ncbi:FMN-binding negative transcriptional regulator [Deinococcus sp. QL22]|uniref:FMN-binding negative transcriptional regulator n=1 Tax=Deinococcus sp. QL22 TaxID=2939437 RepID=UPI002017EB42|nr:FMN-binding negative transcriptional regulator [Deinococcus sp. QL22]UQN08137.1 FMN-binding negative transcriptional regulator [Deinococcus sp. QL22]